MFFFCFVLFLASSNLIIFSLFFFSILLYFVSGRLCRRCQRRSLASASPSVCWRVWPITLMCSTSCSITPRQLDVATPSFVCFTPPRCCARMARALSLVSVSTESHSHSSSPTTVRSKSLMSSMKMRLHPISHIMTHNHGMLCARCNHCRSCAHVRMRR